jgi:hypothetical protein
MNSQLDKKIKTILIMIVKTLAVKINLTITNSRSPITTVNSVKIKTSRLKNRPKKEEMRKWKLTFLRKYKIKKVTINLMNSL